MRGELGRLYDAIENPRAARNELPILRGDELRSYMDEVRARTLEVLDGVDLEDTDDPMLEGGFLYEMLLAHEHQHNETMLQLLQMVESYEPVEVATFSGRGARPGAATRWCGSRAASTRSGPGRGLRLRQRAPAAHRRAGAVLDRPHAGHERAPSPSSWPRPGPSRRSTGSATARAAGSERRWAAPRRSTRATPWSTSTGTRPTPSRAGPGKRLPTEFEWEAAAGGADPERANLDQLASRCSRRRLRRRSRRLRRGADAGRRVGVDRPRTSRPTRASRRSPTPSTRRCSSAPSTRCFAAAPGPPAAT